MGMNVLIVGGGGREHAIAWKIAESPQVSKIFCAPGNAGIAEHAECIAIDPSDISALKAFAIKNRIELTIVGPELPLSLGIVDAFEASGLRVFGPEKKASRLEASKLFAKQIMKDHGIPTADFFAFSDAASARNYIMQKKGPVVIKADGLASGKGVFPVITETEALDAIDRIMVHKEFGSAGSSIVIEDFLSGEEASFICFTDGTTVTPLPSSQDHKRVFDGDNGPNTGGMGAYSPAPVITPALQEKVLSEVMRPMVAALKEQGIIYRGALYAGLMIENGKPSVLEFNVRFGDPETQPLMLKLKTDLVDICNAIIDKRLSELTIAWDPRPAVCVVMSSGGYPGTFDKGKSITGLAEVKHLKDTVVFHAGTVFRDGTIVTDGGRVLGVTACGTTIADAIDNAYQAVDKIHWEGVHYRTDIAYRAMRR
jgi:phosphoribosylamine--glycine ligase